MHGRTNNIGLVSLIQFKIGHGAAVRCLLFTAASTFLFGVSSATADTNLTSGISGSDVLRPYVTLGLDEKWSISDWIMSALLDGRVQYDHGIGDVLFTAEGHAERQISRLTVMEIDISYDFEREKIAAIKHEHGFGADLGLEQKFDGISLKADLGLDAAIFENTTEKGFSSLDRNREENIEFESSLRLTGNNDPLLNPFVEVAFVGREYLINTRRDFAGLDVIFGATFSHKNLTGDVGFFWGTRDGKDFGSAGVIGPQIDLDWTIDDSTKLSFAMGAGIEQDLPGSADLFQIHSMRAEASRLVSDSLKLTLAFEALHENRTRANELELKPELRFDWTSASGAGVFGSADVTYEKINDTKATWEPHVDVGVKLTW